MQERTKKPAKPATRTSIATFDGHSWIWPFAPTTAEELAEEFRGYEGHGHRQVVVPGHRRRSRLLSVEGRHLSRRRHHGFSHRAPMRSTRSRWRPCSRKASTRSRSRATPRRPRARSSTSCCAPRAGSAPCRMRRPSTASSSTQHPEWRCVDRDGTPTFFMSYAYPAGAEAVAGHLRRDLELQPEGVGFLFNRGMPLMLWEDAFCERFKQMHNADAKSVPDDDPRIHATRAAVMTDFLKEVRALLDETAKQAGPQGALQDLARHLLQRSRQHTLGPRPARTGSSSASWMNSPPRGSPTTPPSRRRPARSTWTTIAASRRARTPRPIPWSSPGRPASPQELCKNGRRAISPPAIPASPSGTRRCPKAGPTNPPATSIDVLGKLGHRDDLLRWAKNGVPQPLTIPLTRLDENYFSRWFPNTGF